MAVSDDRFVSICAAYPGPLRLEKNRGTRRKPRCDQVLDHLLLAVNDNAASGKIHEVDVVPAALELQVDAPVYQALAVHAFAHTTISQKLGRPVLEHSGADAALDVFAAPVLEDDRFDAGTLQKVCQHQPCRSCS